PARPAPRPARLPARRSAGDLLGWRPGPAVRPIPGRPLPSAGAGRHRHRHADGARPAESPGAHGDPPRGRRGVPARPRPRARTPPPRRYLDPGYAERVAADLYGGTIRADPSRAR